MRQCQQQLFIFLYVFHKYAKYFRSQINPRNPCVLYVHVEDKNIYENIREKLNLKNFLLNSSLKGMNWGFFSHIIEFRMLVE